MLTVNFVGQVAQVNDADKLQTGIIATSAKENETVQLDFSYYVSKGAKPLELNKHYVVVGDLYIHENKYCINIESARETKDTTLAFDSVCLLAKVHGGKAEPTKYVEINGKRVLQIQMVNRVTKDISNWINVLVYNDKVHQYLEKLQNQSPFYVKGILMFGNYTKGDQTVNTLSMMLNKFEFVSGGAKSTNSDNSDEMEYNSTVSHNKQSTNKKSEVDDIPF